MINRENITELEERALQEISEAADSKDLENVRISYLGRKGKITLALRSIGKISEAERPEMGKLINEVKLKVNSAYKSKNSELLSDLSDKAPYPGDPTLPGRKNWPGGLHVLHRVTKEIKEIFFGMGYSLTEGPDVELDYYNFEALNFPGDHPSRDAQDTFYINRDILMRTQTSPVQVRFMEKHTPPVRIISPGRVYRNETPDPSHSAEFFQMEGLYVDNNVSMVDLKNDITFFIKTYFGSEAHVRFRPHFFPFTEPSAEVDMSCFACKGKGCSVCGKTGWIEIMGAGMVHPNVFRFVGYEQDLYTGFAFGMGIDRIAMLKYGISDIRKFLENDLRFLENFWWQKGWE
ncbi:MAG: phenylalanine--tRNA ligase subunit alpha [Candidatus Krumholzibacteriota bacterium]|nr:phenylalanine--tRNA ligase subunit alpha [Candidatus Krumholzibacteriota bacterium]